MISMNASSTLQLPPVVAGDDAFPLTPNLMKPFGGSDLSRAQNIVKYRTQSVVSSDYVMNFSGVVEDDKVYQVYWAGDARTKGGFYDAKVLYMAHSTRADVLEAVTTIKEKSLRTTSAPVQILQLPTLTSPGLPSSGRSLRTMESNSAATGGGKFYRSITLVDETSLSVGVVD
ncbi:hypothetical protein HPB47_010923 [Ixodes persulcatus]|uniref:Uncharacterized protein n=1 Tax=Ixodes persulcatus TaxID=34615 RepID=A0AC60NXR9_IXOPE|nr:hypothetical protein HPB47_010923 [Ixodes persulcatus]